MLVANLYDFDPGDDVGAGGEAWRRSTAGCWRATPTCAGADRRAYDGYDYPDRLPGANQFITVDVSAFYVDVTKDRLYTFGAASEARRSGQTAMFVVVDGLARLLAPILSVTMDELWRGLPGAARGLGAHGAVPAGPRRLRRRRRWSSAGPGWARCATRSTSRWKQKRQDKTIGGNLSAAVDAGARRAPTLDLLRPLRGVPADALRRLGGHARRAAPATAAPSTGHAGRGREVRSLLAGRAGGEQRARPLGPVSALRRRAGRSR